MKKIFIILFSLFLLTGCLSDNQSESKIWNFKEEISNLQSEIEYLNDEIENLKLKLDKCETEKEEYKEYYDNNCDVESDKFEFTDTSN